jgi:hypothetical protein
MKRRGIQTICESILTLTKRQPLLFKAESGCGCDGGCAVLCVCLFGLGQRGFGMEETTIDIAIELEVCYPSRGMKGDVDWGLFVVLRVHKGDPSAVEGKVSFGCALVYIKALDERLHWTLDDFNAGISADVSSSDN